VTGEQTILGRVKQLAKANINALLDSAEDPAKMLDQLIRDYTDNIAEAEEAVSSTIGNLRLMEADQAEDTKTAEEWGARALAASRRADELRTQGNADEADRFDHLAKVALERQLGSERQAAGAAPTIASQTEVVDQLKSGLTTMKDKLAQLRAKRDELVARSRSAQAQSQVDDALKSINVLDPSSDVSRFEEKVRREEAKVKGQQEPATALADKAEVAKRLAALKGSG
jgi:phage shock protein A